MHEVGLPVRVQDAGVSRDVYESELDALCDRAEMDVAMITSRRIPDREDLKRLYRSAYEGKIVDF
jgi:alcohol dehydrogenase class IV